MLQEGQLLTQDIWYIIQNHQVNDVMLARHQDLFVNSL